MTAWRTSLRTRWLSIVASASRLILSTSLRWSVNFNSWYSGFRLFFWRPAFLSSLCSHETCWVFFVPFSIVGNINPFKRPYPIWPFGSGPFSRMRQRGPHFAHARTRFLAVSHRAAQTAGQSLDGLAEFALGAERLAQSNHAVQ